MAALLAQFMLRLSRDADHFRPTDGPRLATVLVDLLSATLAHELDAGRALLPEDHHRVLVLRIQAFIRHHLADPSPGLVAAAHQISLRQLHRLFEQQDTTVGALIRRQRLERCCHDLADPRLSARSISSIAARWGYPEPTSFSRAFKTLYGTTPREHRHQTQHPGASAVR
ncbi:helix-turn-helix domain-containing protein [Streptomyces sp. NPDC020898]|uniref:helix-turn-helix domain-containing protein n=1 Tax=Streptomyces sp. NPDC020898 TaxID=3365101 RepID=UPI0037ABFAD4